MADAFRKRLVDLESIMRNLVRRYVTVEQRKAENEGVTEDDVNEIKQDISAFRCELIEILKNSGMNTSTSTGAGPAGAGGKKNRQKERRLMKGFNIAPPPASSSTSSLPPVAELIASLQLHNEHSSSHELFGSTISGLLGSTPGLTMRRTYTGTKEVNPQQHPHSLRSLMFKRNSSRKRRWDSLIEAAKSGRVGRLINRSRSEDSVCNGNNGGRLRHSPLSDNNVTDTDSNPSLMENREREPTSLGLSILRHKRRVFSSSRNPKGETGSSLDSKEPTPLKSKLTRASSVPARGTEQESLESHDPESHDQTQSQDQSIDIQPQTILTPSTTEESVTTGNETSNGDQLKRYNGLVTVLPNLPGIQPVSGHNVSAGWL